MEVFLHFKILKFQMNQPISIFWFRRDLRLRDNRGLYEALASGNPVLPIFIFDTEILKELPKDDARVTFIFNQLRGIQAEIQKSSGGDLQVYYGEPLQIFSELLEAHSIISVYTNDDYEPYALKRDDSIKNVLNEKGIPFYAFKDHVIFEKNEIVKEDGTPYVVYTPYMKKWKATFRQRPPIHQYDSFSLLKDRILTFKEPQQVTLAQMGFEPSVIQVPPYFLESERIENYQATRDFPAHDGTSRLGPHLRFGTVSVRQILQQALKAENETFWNELIWREFFQQILWHFPHTVYASFKSPYERIQWRNDEDEFENWKSGKTGFALVDAGMRELNTTGYMHNRVRMLTASFLCKHLLIDWRLGEAYFAEKLLDYELASNVGNWQWASGSGVDAAPYFRIFNPQTQILKFDKELKYIRKWVPEFGTPTYPEPLVDHKLARERCLSTYKAALT